MLLYQRGWKAFLNDIYTMLKVDQNLNVQDIGEPAAPPRQVKEALR